MEDVILYPGVQPEDFHAAMKGTEFEEIKICGSIQKGIGMANSTGSLYGKLKKEVINEKSDLIELDSNSDIEEDFHAVVESMKYEQVKVQNEEIETIRIASSILPEVQKIPRAEQSLQDEKFLQSLCRLCAIPCSDMIYIFGSTILHKSITEKIQHCLPITVEKSDTLSKKVCWSCIHKLESCYQFHVTVMEAEKKLLVVHEQTSGRFTEGTGTYHQTSQCNGQLVIMENADNEETSTRGSDWDGNNIESNDFSYLDKDNGTRDSNSEIENTKPSMGTLNSGRTSAFESRQDNCHATLDSPISKVHPEEGLKSEKTVSDSENHLAPNIEEPSKPQHKMRMIPSKKYSYSLRKRKPMKYTSDNDDGLSCDEVIDGHSPAGQNVGRQLIWCHICKTTLQTTEKCHTHARSHASTNYYPCCFCDKSFETEPEWKEHWLQHDGNAYSPKFKKKVLLPSCNECGKKFATKITLENHKLYHQRRVNNEPHRQACDKVSNSETSAPLSGTQFRNKEEFNHQEEPVFRCICCMRKFSSNDSLERHKEFCFENRKKYICDYCKRIYYQKPRLIRHMRSHTGERPFSCDMCPKSYTTKATLERHRFIHTGERPFSCDICLKSYRDKSNLERHRFLHTGKRPFSCDICPKAFATKYRRDDHHRMHTGERPFVCDFCPKSFTTKRHRDYHHVLHTGTRPFICDICPKSFTNKEYREAHRRKHAGVRFSCDLCSKSFGTKGYRNNHRRLHTGERPYQCSICEVRFHSARALREHKKDVHS